MKKIIFLSVFLLLTTFLSAQPVDQKDEPLTVATAKRGPIITGCEPYENDPRKLYQCFNEKIHVNYNTFLDHNYELKSNTKVRIIISIEVTKDGQINLVKIREGNAPQHIVEIATDAFNKLSEAVKEGSIEIQPAIDNEDKPRNIKYSIPVIFSPTSAIEENPQEEVTAN